MKHYLNLEKQDEATIIDVDAEKERANLGGRMSVEIPSQAFLLNNVLLRPLVPSDIEEFKNLCRDWFPIEYPNGWYTDVTSSHRFYSLAATLNNAIIGVIIAEIKDRRRCNKEDSSILGYWYPYNTKVAYILIVGVKKEFRRIGVASLLLESFLSRLKTDENKICKAVYLHVLPTNEAAIKFYEQMNFRFHRTLWNYYNINGTKRNGYSYVSYINGGEAPWSFFDLFRSATKSICGRRTLVTPFQVVLRLCFMPCMFVRDYSNRVWNL